MLFLLLLPIFALAAPADAPASRPVPSSRPAATLIPAASRPSADHLALRIVRSADGLRFDDQSELLVEKAANPALARLPSGALLVLFDRAAKDAATGTRMHFSQSTDEGRTWSPAAPLRFVGPDAANLAPQRPALVSLPDGSTRLFFIAREIRDKGRAAIRSAVTTDGRAFRIEPTPCLAITDGFEPGLLALHLNNALHLYAGDLREAADARLPDSTTVAHFICRDAKRWAELTPIKMRGVRFAGGVVPVRRFLRTYVEAGGGIASLVTKDGRQWAKDVGLRMTSGRCPAAITLKDGSVLMVYGVDADREKKPPVLAADMGASDQAGGVPGGGAATEGAGERAGRLGESAQQQPGDPNAAVNDAESPLASDDLPFPPKPDFTSRIDYVSWYRDVLLDQGGDNAYPYYAAFMKEPGDLPGSKPEWPELKNIFKNAPPDTAPGPWNPLDHPDWESSNQAAQSLLAMFREATQHEDYASPVQYDPASLEEADAEPLLIGILLPTLSQHRDLARQTLADAWRMEDGRVSSEKMIQALQTTLRGAHHLHKGPTLIEQLVGTAEQNLAHDTARRALQNGVFNDADQMKQALDVLREADLPPADPGRSLRGEYAMAMDTTQYMFEPSEPGAPPAPNPARVKKVAAFGISDQSPVDQMLKMQSGDVTRTIDAFDGYYRELAAQMRVGYPAVRAADIMATQLKYVETSPVTHMMLPVLSRVHQLRARNEASRRATQLSFAVQIYKAQSGQWPASLSELPAEYGDTMRTDPFSGQHFGYRITRDGPVIYSLSENGRDDGGFHSAKWDDGRKPEEGDDHIFWPPTPSAPR